jgi:hypothetical protein
VFRSRCRGRRAWQGNWSFRYLRSFARNLDRTGGILCPKAAQPELRLIPPRQQFNAQLFRVALSVIVLRDTLADLGNRYAYNRVGGRVVVPRPAKYLHPQESFLQELDQKA